MEKVQYIVVGAGLAGLATAWTLAKGGAEVMVVERGDYPGSKNVTGGRLYLGPVRELCGELLEGAPYERQVVKEQLCAMGAEGSVTEELHSAKLASPEYESHTVIRGTFDQWLAEKATEAGAMIVPGYKVDELLMEEGQVIGISADGDPIGADTVVAADGALSFLGEQAGLVRRDPHHFAVGCKEVRGLDANRIEERFGLLPGQGLAQLYFGQVTQGVPGGAFLYTNKESLALGLVLNLDPLTHHQPTLTPHEAFEQFKTRPEIAPLIAGTQPLEYGAHAILEGGIHGVPRNLVRDGFMLTGDAAGLSLSLGLIVRGMDLALVSGVLAGQTLLDCAKAKDHSAGSLAGYEARLKGHVIWKDMRTFKNFPKLLANPKMYTEYPELGVKMMEDMMAVGTGAKRRLAWPMIKTMLLLGLNPRNWPDLFRMVRI